MELLLSFSHPVSISIHVHSHRAHESASLPARKRNGQRHNSCNAIGSYGGLIWCRHDTHARAHVYTHAWIIVPREIRYTRDIDMVVDAAQCFRYGAPSSLLRFCASAACSVHSGSCALYACRRACVRACVRARGGVECNARTGNAHQTGVQIFSVPSI